MFYHCVLPLAALEVAETELGYVGVGRRVMERLTRIHKAQHICLLSSFTLNELRNF